MLKKLLVLALTSGLAAKLYKTYAAKQDGGASTSKKRDVAPTKRPAGTQA